MIEKLEMTKESSDDVEIRKLPAGAIFKLCQILETGEGWKQLMAVIPIACQEGNPPKYTVEHMKLIENAGMCQKRPFTEILLDEWGTSGKCRPTVSVLLQCLRKAELFRAADYVAVELLKGSPPTRPQFGPAAPVEEPRGADFTPSAPPEPLTPSSATLATAVDTTELLQPEVQEIVRLPYARLEEATEGFAEGRKLGGGAWGCVYRASLPRLGPVAVKRLHLATAGGPWAPRQQFHNEIEVLAQLTHPNLLPLLGYSEDGPALCLAYKYMRHGSLLDRLATSEGSPLQWRLRLDIALGTARGLCHLHTALGRPLVHRDVKSANILLDDNYTPKLGDFGLVRMGSNASHTHTVAVTTNVIGTSAYMAREAYRGDVSVKMDVFSFGVVLLELLTGLPPHDENRDGHDLITHVDDADNKYELVDRRAGNWPQDVIKNMFELADSCFKEKKWRPLMPTVIEKLETLFS